MKKISLAVMAIGVAAISQQAMASASTISVDASLVNESMSSVMEAMLASSHEGELRGLAGQFVKMVSDDSLSIDVEAAMELAVVSGVDHSAKSGMDAMSASGCYTNCHTACHGSRSWR